MSCCVLPHTRIATVRTAERPGPDRPSEDRIFTTENAVIVLDGASQPDAHEHDGGWLAGTLGQELASRLTTDDHDLDRVLGDCIATIAKRYGLAPGRAPSTTVAIVRWDGQVVDVLLLGDSAVVALTRSGEVLQLRDERLRRVATRQRNFAGTRPFHSENRAEWRRLVETERAYRNRPDGYWIAEAAPEAAGHGIRARWAQDELAAILVMTDGVTAGVDRCGVPQDWAAAAHVARDDPRRLVDLVHSAEEDDSDGTRWPRGKRHDDKAIAVIDFDNL